MVFFPCSVIDLFGDQALTAREGSDEEMETNASEESDGVCIIIMIIEHHKKKTQQGLYSLKNQGEILLVFFLLSECSFFLNGLTTCGS